MVVLVFNVQADSGGALTILDEFYNNSKSEKDIRWIYVLSTPTLIETENIKVLRYPWVKKSWVHRMFFDYFVAPRIARKYKPDKVVSLQSVIVPRVKAKQTVYVHQALPFLDRKFKINEGLLLWIYQNIFSRKLFKSVKRANEVIVQTNWMKQACIEKVGVHPSKIKIITPRLYGKTIEKHFESTQKSLRTFFYPASGHWYKNHNVIVDAALLLKEYGISDYSIIFTLRGDENKHVNKLYTKVIENNLPIEFIGTISLEKVYEYYSKSVLVFPSFIESFGLPLLEAKLHKSLIIATDRPSSREILQGYDRAYFFDPNDSDKLAEVMIDIMSQ